jgi:AraC-like DNA-binding protein
MYRELRLMIGSQVPIKVIVPCQDINPYRSALNEDVKYGDAHALRFDTALTNRKLNKNSIFTLNEMLPAFMLLIEKAKSVTSFSSSVRCMVLNMATPNLPTLRQVASQFCMTERTFQRKLVAEGNSFRIIISDIKKDLARYLKKSKNLKTQDIAFMLGYSESSSYLHAARQWN